MKGIANRTILIVVATAALGGCAAYNDERPRLAYFIVPCNTPGAFAAQPVNSADERAAAAPQDLLPGATKAADERPKEAPACLIAAAKARPYNSAYSGYGYAPNYPYPRHYGGIGVVLHGGGHRSGHHGGHRRH